MYIQHFRFFLCCGLDIQQQFGCFRIAVVKHLLGLYEEAVVVYKSILAEHCDYVPALKGINSIV